MTPPASSNGRVSSVIHAAGAMHLISPDTRHARRAEAPADLIIRNSAWQPQLPVSASSNSATTALAHVQLMATNTTGSRSRGSARIPRERQSNGIPDTSNYVSPWLIGAGLQLIACIVSACGLVLQRASSIYSPKRALQIAGLMFCVSTAIPDTLSYVFAPQSLLALLCCLEPLLVSGIAYWVLPEDAKLITKSEVVAMVLCVVGTLGCAACAPSSSVLLKGPDEEGSMHTRICLYILMVFPILGWCLWEEHLEERRHISYSCSELMLPTIAGVSLALQRLFMASLGAAVQADGLSSFAAIAFAAITGLAICTLFHVWRGTQEQPPHVFVPIYCGISAAVQLVQSAIVLREYRDEPPDMCIYTILSAGISLAGVTQIYLEHVQQNVWIFAPKKSEDISQMEIRVT